MPLKKISRGEQWRIAGKILQGLRKARNMTQVELAEVTGLKQNNISFAERGKRGIPDEHLAKFAEVLQVPEAALIAPNVIEESELENYVPRHLESLLAVKA